MKRPLYTPFAMGCFMAAFITAVLAFAGCTLPAGPGFGDPPCVIVGGTLDCGLTD